MSESFDAIVVGASIAGCTAATLLGRRGLRVALLERASDPRAYEKVCTHFSQASATKTIQRLGLAEEIEAAGGVRNSSDTYTRFGWIRSALEEYGYDIPRERLDPMVRAMAARTPGVDLRLGNPVKTLVRDEGRVAGVVAEHAGSLLEFRAPLVVAADGRHSKVAELAGVPAEVSPNGRFVYLAYYRVPLESGTRSLIWFLDPDACYAFPNGDVTCFCVMPTRDRIPAFRANLEESFLRMFDGLPRAPMIRGAQRVGEFYGMLEIPNHVRRASIPGLAFVGDAAMTSDPLLGVGCGWAFQTGEWLADHVAAALVAGAGLDQALGAYARHHAERPHHALINKISLGKPFNALERLLFGAAAKDAAIADAVCRLGARLVQPADVIGLGFLARAIWASVTGKSSLPAPPVAAPSFSSCRSPPSLRRFPLEPRGGC